VSTRLRVLLIDDDGKLSELLAEYLRPHGIETSHARDGAEGLTLLQRSMFDVVLLDLMMPGIDGLEVCRRIRAISSVPIIMLTAKGDETDRVVGLEIGADDYVSKPFGPRELLARIRAVMRRSMKDLDGERIAFADVDIDVEGRRVRRAGLELELTAIEFDLLLALAKRAGRVVSRDVLLALAGRGDTAVSERAVDVHISHLRAKLGDGAQTLIRTIRGQGYMLVRSR
jgi:DNA-binding response OmpR family regulator